VLAFGWPIDIAHPSTSTGLVNLVRWHEVPHKVKLARRESGLGQTTAQKLSRLGEGCEDSLVIAVAVALLPSIDVVVAYKFPGELVGVGVCLVDAVAPLVRVRWFLSRWLSCCPLGLWCSTCLNVKATRQFADYH
jgi:hypothetical protein